MSAVSTSKKGELTRRRILDAAAKTFAKSGNTDASLGDIATEAGLKAGSLYFHFDSKDAIVAEVLEVGVAESMGYLSGAVAAAGTSSLRRLKAAIRAHFAARSELTDYAVVLLGALQTEAHVTGEGEKLRRRYTRFWLELVEAAQEDAHLPAALDARLVRSLLFGAMNTELRGRYAAADAANALCALLRLGK